MAKGEGGRASTRGRLGLSKFAPAGAKATRPLHAERSHWILIEGDRNSESFGRSLQ